MTGVNAGSKTTSWFIINEKKTTFILKVVSFIRSRLNIRRILYQGYFIQGGFGGGFGPPLGFFGSFGLGGFSGLGFFVGFGGAGGLCGF